MVARTRLGPGGPWQPYGAFTGKTSAAYRIFRLERVVELAQATAAQKVPVTLVDETDNETMETGVASPTVQWSFEGAAYTGLSDGAWAEIGNGDYTVTFDATDTADTGWGLLRVVKSGTTAETKVMVWIGVSPTERRNDYRRTRSLSRSR